MVKLNLLIKVFWLPGMMFLTYFLMRVCDYQPPTDLDGFSSAIRLLFIAFGCAVCYLMAILRHWPPFSQTTILRTYFWLLAALVLLLLLADDTFMIHETLGPQLGLEDKYLLLGHAVLLFTLLLAYHRRLHAGFWIFLALFGTFACVGFLADNTAYQLQIGGMTVDYEQIAETVAVFFLGSAFGAQAIYELRKAVGECGVPAEAATS